MSPRTIQVKAFAVLLDESRHAHLVWRGSDDSKTPAAFHRLLGGHVAFGETAAAAVEREIFEETGARLTGATLLGVLEERFVYADQPGHEVVFVFAGTCALQAVPPGGGWLSDDGHPIWVEWRSVLSGDCAPPLYPNGVQALIDELLAG